MVCVIFSTAALNKVSWPALLSTVPLPVSSRLEGNSFTPLRYQRYREEALIACLTGSFLRRTFEERSIGNSDTRLEPNSVTLAHES
jgi:hypothetical protein